MKNRNKILEKLVAEHTKDLDKTILELNQEIVERIKAENKVQASLEEKETLLKYYFSQKHLRFQQHLFPLFFPAQTNLYDLCPTAQFLCLKFHLL